MISHGPGEGCSRATSVGADGERGAVPWLQDRDSPGGSRGRRSHRGGSRGRRGHRGGRAGRLVLHYRRGRTASGQGERRGSGEPLSHGQSSSRVSASMWPGLPPPIGSARAGSPPTSPGASPDPEPAPSLAGPAAQHLVVVEDVGRTPADTGDPALPATGVAFITGGREVGVLPRGGQRFAGNPGPAPRRPYEGQQPQHVREDPGDFRGDHRPYEGQQRGEVDVHVPAGLVIIGPARGSNLYSPSASTQDFTV
jgi:hypothetical protein